jgi:hypothetical protein
LAFTSGISGSQLEFFGSWSSRFKNNPADRSGAVIPSPFRALLHTGANNTGYTSAASIFPLILQCGLAQPNGSAVCHRKTAASPTL